MSVPVFGGQTCQVCQVVDVSVSQSREAEAVDVADGHSGEHHLRRRLFIQSRDMWMLQVRDGTLSGMVQKECERSQKGKSPQSLPDAQATRDEDMVNPMEGAGVGKPGQVFDRWCTALLDQALLIPILLAFLLLILLCKFDFANKFDRHVGSQVCVLVSVSDGSYQPWITSLLLLRLFVLWVGNNSGKEEGEKDRREFVAAAFAAACAVTDSVVAAAASAATAPCDYSAAAAAVLLWTLVSLLDQRTQSRLSAVMQLSARRNDNHNQTPMLIDFNPLTKSQHFGDG